jgi:LmbE family N-acetylglucosaminyl deacetylase
MKFLNLDRILCLSAHPDDAEYGMLGTMLLHEETVFDVVVMSSGGDFDNTSGKGRNNECESIWNEFNHINGRLVNDSYIKDKTEDAWVNLIESEYNIIHYNAILTTSNLDSHFEHKIANNVAWALIRDCSTGLVTYKTPSTLEGWIPNYYVNVGMPYIMQTKKQMLHRFESQKNKSYFQEDSLVAFHTNYTASKFGYSQVEHFKIERLFS